VINVEEGSSFFRKANTQKTEFRLNYTHKLSSDFTENRVRVHYRSELLLPFRELNDADFGDYMALISTICGKNTEPLTFKNLASYI